MDRIFQHYKGSVDSLVGAKFSSVKSFNDAYDSDVVLIWLLDERANNWLRVFIDGVYCGIDKYSEDSSSDDLDDHISCVDHSAWFRNKIVDSATVSSSPKPGNHIILSLKFGEQEFRLVCRSEEGDCEICFFD